MATGPSAPAAPAGRTQQRRRRPDLDSGLFGWVALGVLLLAAALLVLHQTRGTTFWIDEWEFVVYRRGGGLDTFLEPHNQHLSLLPVAIYKALFATFGADTYVPFRLVVTAMHLLCGALVFVYARRRVGVPLALAAAALLLFLGPAWQNFLWPFQIAWLASLAAGLGALLLLDREDRRGDVGVSVLIAVALSSSGLGIPIAAGVLVELLVKRRRLKDVWIVAAPVAIYAVWWLAYGDSTVVRHNLLEAPEFMASAAAAATSSVVGLAGQTIPDVGSSLDWGRPLAVAGVGLLVWRLAGRRPVSPRVLALLTIALTFWFMTALSRAGVANPYESRYLYVGGLLILLVAIELVRGVEIRGKAALVLSVGLVLALLSNIGAMREGAEYVRELALYTKAKRGAMELTRPVIDPNYVQDAFALAGMRAGPYLAASDALGTVADDPAAIATRPDRVRFAVDDELVRIHAIELRPSSPPASPGAAPPVDAAAGGTVTTDGGCLTYRPAAYNPSFVGFTLDLTVPAGGVALTADRGAPSTVRLRRFSDTYPDKPLGTLAGGATATLSIRPDLAPQPWHLRVAPRGAVTVCGLGG
ncbi:MAG: hypothetical protein QOH58_3415 [Thermoleophilaceae bacterium]|jgi:hypothetical protein|nr:hypothetical protein [Thermoleophilaceae bacterium]